MMDGRRAARSYLAASEQSLRPNRMVVIWAGGSQLRMAYFPLSEEQGIQFAPGIMS